MFHHRKHNRWQRFIMAIRDIRHMATCSITCPGCGSSNVTGGGGGPYMCGSCGSMWQ